MELNQCLQTHLQAFNSRIHRTFKRSRFEMFEEEKQYLRALPQEPYLVQVHKVAMLHPDCHLVFEKNYYSAPFQYRGKKIDIWASSNVVEIYHDGQRITLHRRAKSHGQFITDKAHYPEHAQAYWDSTAKNLRYQASKVGINTSKLIHQLLSGAEPLQHLRRCQGILRLASQYNSKDVERACEVALDLNQHRYRFIERLVKKPQLLQKDEPGPIRLRGSNPYLRGLDATLYRDKCIMDFLDY